MEQRRQRLVDSATELFRESGFGKTTIQEIADRAEVSKGAFYLHFRSKSEILTAILEEIDREIKAGVRAILENDGLTPRERLRAQLVYQFQDVMEHQGLMAAYINEAGLAIDEHMVLRAQKLRYDWLRIQEDSLSAAYGEAISSHVTDLAVTLSGVLNEYYSYLLLEELPLEGEQIADHLILVLDALCGALAKEPSRPPLITAKMLPGRSDLEQQIKEAEEAKVRRAIQAVRDAAKDLDPSAMHEVSASLDALETELTKVDPNRYVLQGLLANLRDIKDLQAPRRELAAELRLKLV